ncbi:MAG: peptidylprolyl isomerase [Bacteroidota bacterium]
MANTSFCLSQTAAKIWVAFLCACCMLSCSRFGAKPELEQAMSTKAPEKFLIKMYTSRGDVVLEAIRNWSPVGVDRLYQLVQTHYFDSSYIFRVQPDYVAQFGIAAQPGVSNFWHKRPIEDEPLKYSNLKGTVSFAREGPKSRDAQLFINLVDNPKLDTINFMNLEGFPPIARVIEGWDAINDWNGQYGFEPANHQEKIYKQGNAFLENFYPGLDYIIKAEILP